MGNKNKTVSFRIREETFDELRGITDDRNLSLSSLFRDYVDKLVAHDGHVETVPKHRVSEASTTDDEFPVKVTVPKSFVRERERLDLEARQLREQLQEYKAYVTRLRDRLDEHEAVRDDMIRLEDLDEEHGTTTHLE